MHPSAHMRCMPRRSTNFTRVGFRFASGLGVGVNDFQSAVDIRIHVNIPSLFGMTVLIVPLTSTHVLYTKASSASPHSRVDFVSLFNNCVSY